MKHQVASVCFTLCGALKADLRCLRKRSIAENVCHLAASAGEKFVSLRSEILEPIAKTSITLGSQISLHAEASRSKKGTDTTSPSGPLLIFHIRLCHAKGICMSKVLPVRECLNFNIVSKQRKYVRIQRV